MEEKERKERLKHHRKMYRKNMAGKAERNYQMNYLMCQRIVFQILDFATKLAHYRELTKELVLQYFKVSITETIIFLSISLVPAKIVLDWKMLFISGRPLYDNSIMMMDGPGGGEVGMGMDLNSSSVTRSSVNTQHERSNDQLLNDVDFQEYKVQARPSRPLQV